MGWKIFASIVYLVLFVPFGVGFAGNGFSGPYSTVLGTLILVCSPVVGLTVGRWALVLPLLPWTTALVLIALAPETDFVEVSRGGSMVLWSLVFAFIAGLVLAGVIARNRGTQRRPR